MNTDVSIPANTDHVRVDISSEEHQALIRLAGPKNWRYVRMAGALLEQAIARTRSIGGVNCAEPVAAKTFSIEVPVSMPNKIALINLVGGERIAYTTVASRLLHDAIRAEVAGDGIASEVRPAQSL